MQNYYHILGLQNFASAAEIKNAFRKLAKLYHPDINPNSQEYFKNIVKAYEVLSDNYLRSQYDYKLKYQISQSQQRQQSGSKKEGTKSYDFTEKELKRRQYYQEQYKKQYEQSQSRMQKQEVIDERKMSNEFRNILFATPLAVLLIMFILNVWSNKPQIEVVSYEEKGSEPKKEMAKLEKRVITGEAPYSIYYGGAYIDTIADKALRVRNETGKDMLLMLFKGKRFVRSIYVEQGFEVELKNMPKEVNVFRVMQGEDFQYTTELKQAGVYGAFTKECVFYGSTKKYALGNKNTILYRDLIKQGFRKLSEKEFFTVTD